MTSREYFNQLEKNINQLEQRLQDLSQHADRALNVTADRVHWLIMHFLDEVSDKKFQELWREEVLTLLDAADSQDAKTAEAAHASLERFGLAAPNFVPNDLLTELPASDLSEEKDA